MKHTPDALRSPAAVRGLLPWSIALAALAAGLATHCFGFA